MEENVGALLLKILTSGLRVFLADEEMLSQHGFLCNISACLPSFEKIALRINHEFKTSIRLLSVRNDAFECPRPPFSIIGVQVICGFTVWDGIGGGNMI